MVFHGGSLGAKKTNFIVNNVIPGLPNVGNMPPDLFEILEIFRFSDQLVHTQKHLTETYFLIFRWVL